MHSSSSRFESFVNAILLVINIFVVITGLILFTAILLFKYALSDLNELDFLKNYPFILDLINLVMLNQIIGMVIAFSLFLIVLGGLGLYGLVRGRNGIKYLIIYFVLFVGIFLCHMAGLMAIGFHSDVIEDKFRQNIAIEINDLKLDNSSSFIDEQHCLLMKSISSLFKCCEVSNSLRKNCCSNSTGNCANNMVDYFKSRTNIIMSPIFILVALEFAIIIGITFILGSINFEINDYNLRRSSYRNSI